MSAKADHIHYGDLSGALGGAGEERPLAEPSLFRQMSWEKGWKFTSWKIQKSHQLTFGWKWFCCLILERICWVLLLVLLEVFGQRVFLKPRSGDAYTGSNIHVPSDADIVAGHADDMARARRIEGGPKMFW